MYNGQYYWNNRNTGILEKHCAKFPNVWVGTKKCTDNAYSTTDRYQNCMVATDGKHLVASTDSGGTGSALLLWKNIPNESNAEPDVIYHFRVKDNLDDVAIYQGADKTMLMAGGLNSLYIWDDINTALNGGTYSKYYWQKIGK